MESLTWPKHMSPPPLKHQRYDCDQPKQINASWKHMRWLFIHKDNQPLDTRGKQHEQKDLWSGAERCHIQWTSMGGLVDRDVSIKNLAGVDFGISIDFGYILRIFRLGGKIKTFCAIEPQFPKIPHRRHFKHQDCIQWLHLENYEKVFLFLWWENS